MALLSALVRARLVDVAGSEAHVLDLVVDLASGDYSTISHVLYRRDASQCLTPALDVIDVRGRPARPVVHIPDLSSGEPVSDDALDTLVLAKRDILDSLVIDTMNRHVMRANDLWIEEVDGRLAIQAVDASAWAVVRRLGRGLFGGGLPRHLVDWRYIEFLRGDHESAQKGRDYHRRVQGLPPAEIARLADALPYLHAAELLTLLPDPIAADALEVMTPERQLQVFEELNDDQASRLLTLMAPDAAADLVGHLLPDAAQRQLAYLPDERQRRVLELLSFPEDTAGGIMTNDIVVAPAEETVAQVRPLLAQQMTTPDFVYYVFVVDNLEARKLRGILTLRDLLLAKEDQRLRELMYANPLTAGPLEPAVTAARRLIDAHFAALPVVGVGGRLLGAVTVDAAMAQVAPKSWRDQAPRVFS